MGPLAEANTYLREHFIPEYNVTFTRPPADPAAAFVPLGDIDLDQILCEEEERTVGQDNTIAFAGVRLQLAKQPGRPTCAGLRVIVRRHLDGSHTVWRGAHCLGRYAASGGQAAPPRPGAAPTVSADMRRPAAIRPRPSSSAGDTGGSNWPGRAFRHWPSGRW